MLETGTAKTNSEESSYGSVSDSRRPPVKIGGPHSYGWKDMANKILTPLQSLISCFLEPRVNRWAAVDETEGLWQGIHPRVSQRLHHLLLPRSCCQVVEGSLSLIFFVPRIRPMKTESTGQVFSRFSGRLWRGIFSTFSPLFFPPVLQLLSPSMPLLIKYWAGHHLSISESCVWNCLPKIGPQTPMAGTLCYA